MGDPLRILRAAWRSAIRRWPRRFVLRGTNLPVELVHIVEHEREPQCVIRLPDGRRMKITPADLGSRPVLGNGTLQLSCAVALAALVAVLSLPDEPGGQDSIATACPLPP